MGIKNEERIENYLKSVDFDVIRIEDGVTITSSSWFRKKQLCDLIIFNTNRMNKYFTLNKPYFIDCKTFPISGKYIPRSFFSKYINKMVKGKLTNKPTPTTRQYLDFKYLYRKHKFTNSGFMFVKTPYRMFYVSITMLVQFMESPLKDQKLEMVDLKELLG